MHRVRPYILIAVVAVALFALPMTAYAFQDLPNGSTNSFDLIYSGNPTGCGCHAAYQNQVTPHKAMVTDVSPITGDQGLLVPDAADPIYWPSPTYAGGLSLSPNEMYLQLGDSIGSLEYVGNEGDAAVNPIDDLPLWDPLGFSQEEYAWEIEPEPVGAVAYFQRCGGCHNLGVTKPTELTYTLANGAVVDSTTPTEINAKSITCEVCHGSGEGAADAHMGAVPEVVGDDEVMNAQVCGQCHTTGQAIDNVGTKIPRMGSTSFMSAPLAYTVDETLTDYFAIEGTVPATLSPSDPSTVRFFPTGANRNMNHAYYNEWLQNKAANGKGHVDPFNNSAKNSGGNCLKCHSGQGFLFRIGAEAGNNAAAPLYASMPTTANVAANNFGISCQVCHTGHVGMNTAGDDYDFARKWASGAEVTCEDCHNWQFEVLAQTKQTEVMNTVTYDRPAANTRVRHPQREMVSGGEVVAINDGGTNANGMWGVAPAGKFMPTATCNDCHMPETRMGRDSHRFKIMTPGDADTWGAYADSCQPCHPSSSRADLELWIEDTEAEIAAEVAAAQNLLNTIIDNQGDLTRTWTAFMSAQPTTWTIDPAAYALLQKAAQNVDMVVNDGSGGIHNPPYVMAGLAKAMEYGKGALAAIDIMASSDFVPAGAGVGLSGMLVDSLGDPISDAMVIVEYSTDGGATWGEVATVMTMADGSYSAVYAGPINADTMFRTHYHVDGVMIGSDDITVGVVVAGGVTPERLAGATRFDTSIALSKSVFDTGSVTNIVMASGQGFPDALSAAGLAGTVGSPIMLTNLAAVPTQVMTEIDRLSATDDSQTTVWIVGGTGVVSNAVVAQLEAEGYSVERLFGANRYQTSVAVAEKVAEIAPGAVDMAFVANGENFADALAASPVAWSNGMPILLTPPASLNASIAAAYEDIGYNGSIALGGIGAVSADVVADLEAISGDGTVDRWFGPDRYATAVAIATEAEAAAMADFSYVGVANGLDFPDALAGGPVAGSYGGVMVLVTPTTVPAPTSAFFTANKAAITTVEVYGGTGAVSNGVMTTIEGLLQ